MSKIALQAFGGALKGTYNLPENWDGRDLWLLLDMDLPHAYELKDEPDVTKVVEKRARFQYTGKGYYINGKDMPIYKLVEIA